MSAANWVVSGAVNRFVNWVVDWAVGRVVDFFGMPIGVVDNGVVDFGVVDSGVVNFGEIYESFGVIITWVLGLGFGVLGFGFWGSQPNFC